MPQVKATPVKGARVRKPDGSILRAEGEAVERSSFWVRRKNDGDVMLEDIVAAAPEPEAVTDTPATVAKPKK